MDFGDALWATVFGGVCWAEVDGGCGLGGCEVAGFGAAGFWVVGLGAGFGLGFVLGDFPPVVGWPFVLRREPASSTRSA